MNRIQMSSLFFALLALSFAFGPNLSFAAPSDESRCHCVGSHAQEGAAGARKRPSCHPSPAADTAGETQTQDDRCQCRTKTSVAGSTCSCRHHGADGITLADRSLIPATVTIEYDRSMQLVVSVPALTVSVACVPDTPPPRISCAAS